MDETNKIMLVTGATGRQGGATARHLLANGWHVRAIVRDLDTPAAQALRQSGAEVIQGDNENRASLETAMQGVYGVFSVQEVVLLFADASQLDTIRYFAREFIM